MRLKKAVRKIHLWLGLLTGPVVFIIAITGCIYVFQEEISDATQSYRFVPETSGELLPPSKLKEIAEQALPEKTTQRIYYNEKNKAAFVRLMSSEYYYLVFINPYTGDILKVKDMYNDFFYNIFRLHVHLLLPVELGKKITSISTFIFLFIIISGLFLWWPGRKKKIKSSFAIKYSGSKKRLNYDLHKVLGFYVTWIVIFSAVTGLIWGFQWFGNMTYWVSSGGESKPDLSIPAASVQNPSLSAASNPLDSAFKLAVNEYPNRPRYMIFLPPSKSAAIGIAANPSPETYYKMDYVYYNQQTMEKMERPVYGKYSEASVADIMLRMNYDIHVGSIGGIAGKLILFFVSLIVASLPVTGFLIWYRKKVKKTFKSFKISATKISAITS